MTKKQTNRKQVYKVNYGGATPEQVTLALLRYRPNAPAAVKKRLPPQIQGEDDSSGVKSAI